MSRPDTEDADSTVRTNYEAIQAMSDVKLAEWMEKITSDGDCGWLSRLECKCCRNLHGGKCICASADEPCPECGDFVLAWLRQPEDMKFLSNYKPRC